MKVILIDEIRGLGTRGDVVTVKEGYARNFLIPKNLAREATPGNLKSIEQERKKWALLVQQEKEKAQRETEKEREKAQKEKEKEERKRQKRLVKHGLVVAPEWHEQEVGIATRV